MAKQTGLIKVKGTLDNVTFYQTQDGNLVKMKTSIEKSRIMKDPAFARTRENGSEFGLSAKSGKLFRDTLRVMTMNAVRGRIAGRITQLMTQIKNLDTNSIRGDRNVGAGISTSGGKALLKGLEFNTNALLGSVLLKPYSLVPSTGVISIPSFVPINDILWPQGATHMSLTGGYAVINFITGAADLKLTNVLNVARDIAPGAVTLTPTAVPTGTGTKIYLLKIEFFQLMNGVQYSLRDGTFNALRVIEVA